MIGIYKIISPTKKVYIGQSIDIEKRFNTYKNLNCKTQPIIYNSLLKYGFEKHKFEILEECSVKELNDKERYYQDLYSAVSNSGMNCKLTKSSDKSGVMSEYTRLKMIGKKLSEDSIKKRTESRKGYTHSEETKKKIRDSNKGSNLGKIHSEETRKKVSEAGKGRTHSEETKRKLSESHKGKIVSKETRKKLSERDIGKLILNTENGVFYYGIKKASESICMTKSTLYNQLTGRNINKTPLIYV